MKYIALALLMPAACLAAPFIITPDAYAPGASQPTGAYALVAGKKLPCTMAVVKPNTVTPKCDIADVPPGAYSLTLVNTIGDLEAKSANYTLKVGRPYGCSDYQKQRVCSVAYEVTKP